MKKFLTLLAAAAFASTALFAQAATPKAAEDPNAPVMASDKPVPKVRKLTPQTRQAKVVQTKARKAGSAKQARAAKGKKTTGARTAARKRA